MAKDRRPSIPLALLSFVLKSLWTASAVAIPALGVWISSSIAAYRNGPVWLACLCGLLLFPLVPLLWDGLASWRRSRSRAPRPRILTFTDRLILRTWVLNLAVLAGLLVRFPETTFAALSTRGDWLLDGRAGPRVEQVRVALFRAADGLEWLYDAVHANPYVAEIDPGRRPEPPPAEPPKPTPVPEDRKEQHADPGAPEQPVPGDTKQATPVPQDIPKTWPQPATLHPLVAALPATAEASIADVGRYIAEREPDHRRRVKALHDYVADRIAYDAEAYRTRQMPPQDAETVFRTRMGVCAGYANLLAALGDAAGEEIVVVVGDARTRGSDLTGEGHAWNAAHLDGAWTLIDATWDAGGLVNGAFEKGYRTEYLFAPPAVFGVTHFPDEARWQLRSPELSRGEFFRQPMMRAEFYAAGLELVAPDRPQVSVAGSFEAVVRNPSGQHFLARARGAAGGEAECRVETGATATIRCDLPAGEYQVELYAAPEEFGSYPLVGSFEVHSAGA